MEYLNIAKIVQFLASEGNTSLVSETSLDIGSMVEVKGKNVKPRYGVIRWMGYILNSDKKIAGLEMVTYVI